MLWGCAGVVTYDWAESERHSDDNEVVAVHYRAIVASIGQLG